MVPTGLIDLDEADTGLSEALREDALTGVLGGGFFIGAIHLKDALRLVGKIEQSGRLGLHAEGEFERLDETFHFRIRGRAALEITIQALDQFELGALLGHGLVRIPEITNGGLFCGNTVVPHSGALTHGGEECI
jgi:hypothetical protein